MTSAHFHIKEHVLPCQHIREYARATAFKQEDELHLAIKQYTPLDNPNPQPGDITIIGAHANGYPKELYEPLWIDLHSRAKTSGFRIRNIWIADVAHQGASSVLNEQLLGNDPSWHDHARDLLHMINTFRREMPLPLVGIGHSMGACQLANLSLIHPRLLFSLILIEPVIQSFPTSASNIGLQPACLSTFRRDIWPSRSAAAASFLQQKYYQAWDRRVFDLWLDHGLRDTPTAIYPNTAPGSVTLSTTRHQEVWTFLRPHFDISSPSYRDLYPDYPPGDPSRPFYRPEPPIVCGLLPHLRPSVLYIFGATSAVSSAVLQADKVRRTGTGVGGSGGAEVERVKSLCFEGHGHLVPMEAVTRTAEECAGWVAREVERWREETRDWEVWAGGEVEAKRFVDGEWVERMREVAKVRAKI